MHHDDQRLQIYIQDNLVSPCQKITENIAPSSNRIKQGQIRDEVQRVGTVVIVTNDYREEDVVLEDNRLRLPRVPLRPRDPQAILAVRVEVVREPNHIVLQIALWAK